MVSSPYHSSPTNRYPNGRPNEQYTIYNDSDSEDKYANYEAYVNGDYGHNNNNNNNMNNNRSPPRGNNNSDYYMNESSTAYFNGQDDYAYNQGHLVIPNNYNDMPKNAHSAGSQPYPPLSSVDSTVSLVDHDPVPERRRNSKTKKSKKFRRYCCYCIPKSKRGKIICAIFTVLFLVMIALILYFFIPRIPKITPHTVAIDNSGGSLYSLSLPDSTSNVFSVSAQAKLNISVSNENVYALDVENMDVNLYILGNSTVGSKIQETEKLFGTGNLTYTFPKKKTVSVLVPLTVGFSYDNGYQGALTDPGLKAFMNACGVAMDGSEMDRGTFKVHYKATAYVKGLRSLGINPVFQNYVNVGCPFSTSTVATIKSQIEGMFTSGTSS